MIVKRIIQMGIWIMLGLLAGCGDAAIHRSSNGSKPGAPTALEANVGDGAVSLGWSVPTTDGGAPVTSYTVRVSPRIAPANVIVRGTAAIVRGLTNGTFYTFTVAGNNSTGQGPDSAPLYLMPSPANISAYVPMAIKGDESPSGIFDPSPLKASSGKVWLAYSSVNYYKRSGYRVQDVSTRIAKSSDGGKTFTYVETVGKAHPATIADKSGKLCGKPTCTGRWVYEVPWIIEDRTDPDPARRFKLFAHKYFLYPPAGPESTQYAREAIVMRTASTPGGDWSSEQTVLGWDLTPPELHAQETVNRINPALAPCLFLSEGGAPVHRSALDFTFSCFYIDTATKAARSKIVMLRSKDHAKSFQYVATLLNASDAAAYGADYFTASSLLPAGGSGPVLLATKSVRNTYEGCLVFPFANEQTGNLFRQNGSPVAILDVPPRLNRLGGGCAWDRGLDATGILMDDVDLTKGHNGFKVPFRILATKNHL